MRIRVLGGYALRLGKALLRAVGCLVIGVVGFALYLPFSDGPVLVFPGGPIRSGDNIAFEDVDWLELDGNRELELEVKRTGRSRLLWFSVHGGVPYFSCGFGCAEGFFQRWPHHVERDPRVTLRVDGQRIEAQMKRVSEEDADYAAARAGRRNKFNNSPRNREAVESEAAGSVVRLGRRVSEESGSRLYKAIARQEDE